MRQLRRRFLAEHPLCADCADMGKVRAAQQVHHLTPIQRDPGLRLAWSNLVALCETCHNARHGR